MCCIALATGVWIWQIDQLRTAIQSLCRATNPLGRVVDYIQEDVDSMQKDMQTWKQEKESLTAKLNDEEKFVALLVLRCWQIQSMSDSL